ncbi:MAG: YqgE/AlgH family protein [Acidobacteria bacterium]|nr:YqgE/AlgH family protein [Acidobacteriota bacterium]
MGAERPQVTDSLAPGLIVAMPQLLDPNFRRSVVLLLRSNEHGAFGLIINRTGSFTMSDLCRNQGITYNGPEDLRVMVGGPVETDRHLLVLHGDDPVFPEGSEDEVLICPGVFLVTAREGLEALARRGTSRLRCYTGYAGWGPGQLEAELASGAWVPLPHDDRLVFDEDARIVWDRALRAAGIDPITLVPPGGPPS